jgi:hypothetical protein
MKREERTEGILSRKKGTEESKPRREGIEGMEGRKEGIVSRKEGTKRKEVCQGRKKGGRNCIRDEKTERGGGHQGRNERKEQMGTFCVGTSVRVNISGDLRKEEQKEGRRREGERMKRTNKEKIEQRSEMSTIPRRPPYRPHTKSYGDWVRRKKRHIVVGEWLKEVLKEGSSADGGRKEGRTTRIRRGRKPPMKEEPLSCMG